MKKISNMESLEKALEVLSKAKAVVSTETKIYQDSQRAATELFDLKTKKVRVEIEETVQAIEQFVENNKIKVFPNEKKKSRNFTYGTLKLRKSPDSVQIDDSDFTVEKINEDPFWSQEFIETKYFIKKKIVQNAYKENKISKDELDIFGIEILEGLENLIIDTI